MIPVQAAVAAVSPETAVDAARLVDDTYNANPQSMRAALESLSRLGADGRGVAVLGAGRMGQAIAATIDQHDDVV